MHRPPRQSDAAARRGRGRQGRAGLLALLVVLVLLLPQAPARVQDPPPPPQEVDPAEAARLEAERLEAERVEAEQLELERLEAERLQRERIEEERRVELTALVPATAAELRRSEAAVMSALVLRNRVSGDAVVARYDRELGEEALVASGRRLELATRRVARSSAREEAARVEAEAALPAREQHLTTAIAAHLSSARQVERAATAARMATDRAALDNGGEHPALEANRPRARRWSRRRTPSWCASRGPTSASVG